MLKLNSELRAQAREALRGKWPMAAVAALIQSPNQKIPDRKTKCVIETHLNIKQNVILGANLKPV